MNAKDILNNLQQAEYSIMSAKIQQEAIQSLASYPIHYNAKTATILKAEYKEALEEIRLAEKRRAVALLEVNNLIATLPNPAMKEVFRLRYIDRLKWETIAERTCYSIGYVQRLHKKALEALGKS